MSRKSAHSPGPSAKGRKLRLGMLVGGVCVLATCIAARYYWGTEAANANPTRRPVVASGTPRTASSAARTQPEPMVSRRGGETSQMKIVAAVNGEEISRSDLARECLRHYGEQVLERMANKYLILQECKRRDISVAPAEVNAEIERLATSFSLPVQQFLKVIEDERGIDPQQYSNDIIWPTLALRKLAGQRLEVTQEELKKQFEAQYGRAVKARLIVCNDRRTAEKVRAEAVANPERFGELAKANSQDIASASANGLIQPIRRHVGHKQVEDVAFSMKEGDISDVIQVGDQYAILKCEGLLPARGVTFEQVKMSIMETIRDAKTRQVAHEIFRELQKDTRVVNVLNDPVRRRQMPATAALIDGHRITERELAQQCIQRHGKEVLEGTINRRLLEQACKKRNIKVAEEDVDQEIIRAASLYLEPKEDGSPDVQRWLEMAAKEQGVSVDVYRSDSVWPSVALKKLVGDQVEVTDEDLRRGYEANYGPRVRCLAIVLSNLRRAQRVWEMARNNPTPEFFGDLAQQYSEEASSRALRGEVPPIQKHGGQPLLEKAAFALGEGELSNIIQVGHQQYVILLCQGRTEPVEVRFDEVRDLIYQDIYEKKQRIAMAEYFQKLQDGATVDNYLAGTSRSPRRAQTTARSPTLR